MKKIILFACVAVLAFASCGNKNAAPAEAEGADVETVVDEAVALVQSQLENADPAELKAALANLQAVYAKLVEEGNLEGAKAYASAIQKFVAENSEALQKVASGEASIVSLIEGVKNLPTSAEATAEDAMAAVQTDAKALANVAKAAAEAKVEDAKEAAKEKVEEAVAPAVEKVNEAAAAVDAAKAKANEKNEQAKATVDAAKKLIGR